MSTKPEQDQPAPTEPERPQPRKPALPVPPPFQRKSDKNKPENDEKEKFQDDIYPLW